MAPATKKWCQLIRSAAPVTQNHLSKPEDLMLQNATLLGKAAPWPPSISDEHVSCIGPATENASFQILFKGPTPAIIFEMLLAPHVLLTLGKVLNSLRLPHKTTSEPSKAVWACGAFNMLKRASRHQPRTLFEHVNFQKCSQHVVLCAFWLRNVLRATTACTFSTSQLLKCSEAEALCAFWLWRVLRATTACTFSSSQLPKVVRTWCALYILTSKCASRHNGVQFFISHLTRCLRTRRFSEPTFRPSGATNHWHSVATFYLLAHLHLLSSDSFSSLIFSLLLFSSLLVSSRLVSLLPFSSLHFSSLLWLFLPLLFHLSILSEVWLLN